MDSRTISIRGKNLSAYFVSSEPIFSGLVISSELLAEFIIAIIISGHIIVTVVAVIPILLLRNKVRYICDNTQKAIINVSKKMTIEISPKVNFSTITVLTENRCRTEIANEISVPIIVEANFTEANFKGVKGVQCSKRIHEASVSLTAMSNGANEL